jgi:hypothetical protein
MPGGACCECGTAIADAFGEFKKAFGPRRTPFRLVNFHA